MKCSHSFKEVFQE